MRPTRMVRYALVTLAVLCAVGARVPLRAQEVVQPSHISLNAGLVQLDMAGSGWGPMLAGRAAFPLANVFLIEGSILASRPGQDIRTTTMLMPEAQIQLALPFTRVVPYMGLGAGAAIDFRGDSEGGTRGRVTISGSVGGKWWLREGLGAQVEWRARGVGADFEGSANEYSLGFIHAL